MTIATYLIALVDWSAIVATWAQVAAAVGSAIAAIFAWRISAQANRFQERTWRLTQKPSIDATFENGKFRIQNTAAAEIRYLRVNGSIEVLCDDRDKTAAAPSFNVDPTIFESDVRLQTHEVCEVPLDHIYMRMTAQLARCRKESCVDAPATVVLCLYLDYRTHRSDPSHSSSVAVACVELEGVLRAYSMGSPGNLYIDTSEHARRIVQEREEFARKCGEASQR